MLTDSGFQDKTNWGCWQISPKEKDSLSLPWAFDFLHWISVFIMYLLFLFVFFLSFVNTQLLFDFWVKNKLQL